MLLDGRFVDLSVHLHYSVSVLRASVCFYDSRYTFVSMFSTPLRISGKTGLAVTNSHLLV